MHQQHLFEPDLTRPPGQLARASDPASSHDAARRVIDSGNLRGQMLAVLEALRRQTEALTSAELAAAMDVDRYLTARRLPDLERIGLAARCGERVCRARGGAAVIWRAR